MYRASKDFLGRLAGVGSQRLLRAGKVGIEKETLRVSPDGKITQTPHPQALGAALTHPHITTDYSEALLEFVTPAFTDISEVLGFLRDTQQFVYAQLRDEILWATSMPCVVAGETSIPIARYGSSNAGTMKTVYRRGLGHRYGRVMQVIAGVHFNYSFNDALWPVLQELEGDRRAPHVFSSERYFGVLRNLQRLGWLVPYLFGASPAVCKSFLGGKPTTLAEFNTTTYYEPFGTSLRMGDIGYQNNKETETGIKANYDGLEAYIQSLEHAISTPWPAYEKIGVVVNGQYEQLNPNLLQIENEYYSTVRPKQLLNGNEKPIHALRSRGVRYVELRSLDVNAFDPLGVHEDQLRFLEALMVFCLIQDSPRIDARERREIDYNELAAAHRGRDPDLQLQRGGREVTLRDWASEVCESMEAVCALLDGDRDDRPYAASLEIQRRAVQEPQRTPAARMLAELRTTGEGFYDFARRMSLEHQRYFSSLPVDEDRFRWFRELGARSHAEQATMEAADEIPFGEYLRRYFAQDD
ncbi:MAG: glutamate--cysteine ligase [Chromatiales bacterium 21-64-14]|nr:MAG: glutamate--cysteine ligase [Chromatiales bacterium 21-64-14]HQU16472.1 glutamate--cysteine ligase [Gammaproteobacteria bacterium]